MLSKGELIGRYFQEVEDREIVNSGGCGHWTERDCQIGGQGDNFKLGGQGDIARWEKREKL